MFYCVLQLIYNDLLKNESLTILFLNNYEIQNTQNEIRLL